MDTNKNINNNSNINWSYNDNSSNPTNNGCTSWEGKKYKR
jgi:hypothetical protein